jgi:hypothetical protein
MTDSNSNGYQGWTNWDTWNTDLWLNNEEHAYYQCLQFMHHAENSCERLGESPKLILADTICGFWAANYGPEYDGIRMNRVNWDEIAEAFWEAHHDE